MQPTQWSHGFTHHSKVRKKDCQEWKHIGTSYNLMFLDGGGKGFWSFQRMVEDPIEEIGYAIMKYTKCGYGLHLSS